MAKRSLGPLALEFTCTGPCGKVTRAAKDSVLGMLALCATCQDARFAAGLKSQREALALEAAGLPRA